MTCRVCDSDRKPMTLAHRARMSGGVSHGPFDWTALIAGTTAAAATPIAVQVSLVMPFGSIGGFAVMSGDGIRGVRGSFMRST